MLQLPGMPALFLRFNSNYALFYDLQGGGEGNPKLRTATPNLTGLFLTYYRTETYRENVFASCVLGSLQNMYTLANFPSTSGSTTVY